MKRNGEALTRLVDDILDVSRIVSGSCSSRPKTSTWGTSSVPSSSMRGPRRETRRLPSSNPLRWAPAWCEAHPVRLQQVAANPGDERVSSSPRKEVTSKRTLVHHQAGARLTVRDDGCGIGPADLPHRAFPASRQLDDARHGGLGLGLAIARHIVDAHGGAIDAQSEGLDRGSCFTVTLPESPPPPWSRPACQP